MPAAGFRPVLRPGVIGSWPSEIRLGNGPVASR